jgi:hypothetical protein
VLELPADLAFDGFWPVGAPKASRLHGICGGTEGVRAHVADGDGLTGGSGSGRCGGILYVTRTDATGKSTANFLGGVELSAGERPGPSDESPRAAIIWSLSLKEPENPVGAVGGPRGDKAAAGFAERLWRSHDPFLYLVGQAYRGRTRRRPPSVARRRRRSHCMPVEFGSTTGGTGRHMSREPLNVYAERVDPDLPLQQQSRRGLRPKAGPSS